MIKKDLEFYKNLLIEEKNEIIKEILETDESAKQLINNDSFNVNDNADDAANNITQNILNILSITSKKTLISIDAALRRIEEENFGNCIGCGEEISANRLKAIPWASMCINCKNKNEKNK